MASGGHAIAVAAGAADGAVPVHIVLPHEILSSSPSFEDGVPAPVERAHRFFGCELIQEAGILLRLPQVAMATAQTLLHRFYYRKSLRDFDAFRVAIGCLFLAAKVEERPRRIKDVLSVFYVMFRRRKWRKTRARLQLLDVEGATFCKWRDWLVMVERQILIDMGFSIYNVTEHPHKYVLYYVKVLDGSKELAQRAWGYINDSLRIDLCVRFRAEEIACAAIFLASRALGISLPEDPAWHALFDVDKKQLLRVSVAIMGLYTVEHIDWVDPLTEVDPFAVDEHPFDAYEEEEEEQQQTAEQPKQQETEEEEKQSTEPPATAAVGTDKLQEEVTTEGSPQEPSGIVNNSPEPAAPTASAGNEEARRDRSPRRERARTTEPQRSRRRRSRSRSSSSGQRERRRERRRRSRSRSRSRSSDRRGRRDDRRRRDYGRSASRSRSRSRRHRR